MMDGAILAMQQARKGSHPFSKGSAEDEAEQANGAVSTTASVRPKEKLL